MRRKLMFLIVGFIAVAMMGLPGSLPAQQQKPIVIGMVHSLSGTYSIYGISSKAGAEIAIEEINAKGGILGRPLKLIARDDKVNPEVGLREAKDLVLNEKVDFLTGTISSVVALAISNYVKREKKIFIVNGSQSSSITEEHFNPHVSTSPAQGWMANILS